MGPEGNYFLQAVKVNEEPKWPIPEADLVVGSQLLQSGYIQYWAYPKESGKSAQEVPNAEKVALKHQADYPAILIDQNGGGRNNLELILVKDGHAWAKVESSLENLEDNLSSILEFAKNKFNINVEHFMTSDKVSEEVDEKLNQIESSDEAEEGSPEETPKEEESEVKTSPDNPQPMEDEPLGFHPVSQTTAKSFATSGIYATHSTDGNKSSKMWMILPIVVLLIVFAGAIFFKDKLVNKFIKRGAFQAEVTPTPILQPTPTPTPSLDRSKINVRVLNGTLTSGAASGLGDKLKTLGWNVVKVGNAPTQDALQTTVSAKTSSVAAIGVMMADIKDYQAASSSSSLKSTDTVDLEVVIGSK